MKINIASKEIIHFIGVGGIGMSGLAQIMKNMGFAVQGSDSSNSKNTDRLVKSGIKVSIGHDKKNIKRATMVVISSAIKKNNKEIIAAKNKKIPIFTRGELLANIVTLKKKYCCRRFSWKNYHNIINCKCFSRIWTRSYSYKWRNNKFS